ncbi:DUF4397 domain-containing protein [Taibaiella soli]|uniref:DUF4397 domain-containing protein n=1 Tax=Taibaiella soli TaxID=1649169 RepID=A0A2W2BAU3_9BACT|nr:DUF4397 domain-containing protein [Taibaiella soli]PZF73017.1 hypothetical protein DN068_11450 [Taibaiella soli]
MKKILVAILGFAAIGTVSSCKKDDNSTPTTAKMMFFNGTVAAANVDGTINSAKVSSASNIAYLNKTGYVDVATGGVSVGYLLTITQTSLVNNAENLAVSKYYSAFAGGIVTKPSLVFTSDDLSAPSANMAKIRLVNLSPDSLNEAMYIGTNNNPIVQNVGPQTASDFSETAAGTVKITLQDPSKPTQQVTIASQNLAAGKIYTIVLTGSAVSTGNSVLTANVVNNN